MSDGIDFQPTESASDGIDFQPMGQSFLQETASNILPDVEEMTRDFGSPLGKIGEAIPGALPLTTMAQQAPKALDVVRHPTEAVESIARPFTHPIQFFKEHPVQQTLNAIGAGSLAARGVGSLMDAIPATENMVPTVERVADNQTLKSLGGTMNQIKQMEAGQGGRAALHDAAKYARDSGITDVLSTGIGREKTLEGLLNKSGENLGALRKEAGPASPDIIKRVVDSPKIDKYLGQGSASRELGGVDQALADIKEVGGDNPTHESLAKAATYINKNAAGNKLYQPVNAETDVANALSHENNADIAQKLGSEKAKAYVDALGEQEKLHPLEHLQNHGELREMAGRGGLGVRLIQEIADRFGYRMTAKAAAALHDALVGNGLTKNLSRSVVPAALNVSGEKQTPDQISDAVATYLKREFAGSQRP